MSLGLGKVISLRLVEPSDPLECHAFDLCILKDHGFDSLACFVHSFADLMLSADLPSHFEILFPIHLNG